MRSFFSGLLALSLSVAIPLSGIDGPWMLRLLWAVAGLSALYFVVTWGPLRKRLARASARLTRALAEPVADELRAGEGNASTSVAAGGNADVMLALVFRERGDLTSAELHLRRAVAAGHAEAATLLGLLLRDRGDLAEAEHHLREAADRGQRAALMPLGMVLRERGNLDEAELFLGRAAQPA